MKPNDKAIEAALNMFHIVSREVITDILTAAYAAQFPPSEDYADIIRALRVMHGTVLEKTEKQFRDGVKETMPSKAADALEVVLAARKSLTAAVLLSERQNEILTGDVDTLRSERDALLARLAPVEDDEELVGITVTAIHKEAERGPIFGGNLIPAVIAAIRPHIEAAERERCAKAVEKVAERINVAHHERPEWEDGYLQGVHDAAAAIRSGK